LAAALSAPAATGVTASVTTGATTVGKTVLRSGARKAIGKAAIVVAGAAVVIAGVAAVTRSNGSSHSKPPVASAPVSRTPVASPAVQISVKLNSLNQTLTGPPIRVQGARYVQVSGLPDPAVQTKINKALRAPLDAGIKKIQQFNGGPFPATEPAVIRATAVIGVQTATLLSVSNVIEGEGADAESSGFAFERAVTVDLRTGRELGARDIWSASTLTAQGMATLKSRLTVQTPQDCKSLPVVLKDFLPAKGYVRDTAFFTPEKMELLIDWTASTSFGHCTDQLHMILTAPISKIRDLLKPEFAAQLPTR
jgi:serine/threonine-protein kinase